VWLIVIVVCVQAYSLISASVDAREREAMTELTAPSSLRSSLQPATTVNNEEDPDQLANGTSGQLTCKSSLQTFSVRGSAKGKFYEVTGDEEMDSICAGLPGYDSVPLTVTRQRNSGTMSGVPHGSVASTRDIINGSINGGGQPGTSYSTAAGTQFFETGTSFASSRFGGSQIPTPNRTRSPAVDTPTASNAQLMQAVAPTVLMHLHKDVDADAPAQACCSDEEHAEGDEMFTSTTTPPEGGYVRSLLRNAPWRTPQPDSSAPYPSEAHATPTSCPLQVSPCLADPPHSSAREDIKTGRCNSTPLATAPVISSTAAPAAAAAAADDGEGHEPHEPVQTGGCSKVKTWLQDVGDGCNAAPAESQNTLPSSPGLGGMNPDDALIPWMPSGTEKTYSPEHTENTQQQEREREREHRLHSEQQSSQSFSRSVAAPAHCLETEIGITSVFMPPGNVLDTADRGPVILDSATGQPCTVLRMISESSNPVSSDDVTGRVIVCTYAEQVLAIEERAKVCDVCPPILPLQAPAGLNDSDTSASVSSTLRSAPAVCFACTETLEDEIRSGVTRSSPESAALLLASLCALLERLHIAGYTSGGLTPEIVVRPAPCSRPGDWRLMCAHSVLQQGSTAEPVLPLNIRWCAPEQLMFAKGIGGATGSSKVLGSAQQPSSSGQQRASPITTPSMGIADVASDMFCLGLIVYNAVTGSDYWGDYTDEQVAEVRTPLTCDVPLLQIQHQHPA
jgi:hypothetical protein